MSNSAFRTQSGYYDGYREGYNKGVTETLEKYGSPETIIKYILVTKETYAKIKDGEKDINLIDVLDE